MSDDDDLEDEDDIGDDEGECWACGGEYDGGFFIDAAIDHKARGWLPDGSSMFDPASANDWRDGDGVLMGDLLYETESYLFGYATSCEGCGGAPDVGPAIEAWRNAKVDPAKVTSQDQELRRLAEQLGLEPDGVNELAALWAKRPSA